MIFGKLFGEKLWHHEGKDLESKIGGARIRQNLGPKFWGSV